MKIHILTLSLILVVLSLIAQQPQNFGQQQADKKIKGIIKDSITQLPLEYASVAVFRVRDSSLAGGAITNIKGEFEVTNLTYGRYFMKINYVGYKPKNYGPFIFSPDKGDEFFLGTIYLSLTSTALKGVEVTAEKPIIEMNLEKKVVNIEGNLTTQGGNALDVLQAVPSVSVDMDGNISFRGSENVTILIDGRPAVAPGLTKKTVLEQIPADMIQSIELITNPSAKYDPEGTSGIINIILKQRKSENITFIAGGNVGTTNKYNANLNFSVGSKKIKFYANYNYRNDERNSNGKIIRTNLTDLPVYIHSQKSEGENVNKGHNFNLGTDFYLDAKNTLSVSFRGNTNDLIFNNLSENTELARDNAIISQYKINSISNGSHNSLNSSIFYTKKFEKPTQLLTFDFSYTYNQFKKFDTIIKNFYSNNWSLIEDIPSIIEQSKAFSSTNEYMSKLDYTHPINENIKLETGFNFRMRSMKSSNIYYQSKASLLEYLPERSLTYLFDENIIAAYVNYTQNINKIGISAGMRIEEATTNPRVNNDTNSYQNSYFSFYPNFSASYNIKKGESIQLSYSKRVNRPDFMRLSPFIDYSDAPNLRGGNPYLKPEYIHSIDLSYLKIFKATTLNPSVFYRRTIDLISRYRITYQDTMSLATFMNIATADAYGCELMINQAFSKNWRINASGSLFYTKVNGENISEGLTNDDLSWNFKITSITKFFKALDFQVNAVYRGPSTMLQGRRKEMFFTNAGLKYTTFKNRLVFSLNVNDVFNTMRFGVKLEDKTFIYDVSRKMESRYISFGVNYQFNAKNIKQQERRRGEDSNMDIDVF